MAKTIEEMRLEWAKGDSQRDSGVTIPEDVQCFTDLSYGEHGTWNLLDVYRPAGTEGKLPTIVSIHGGGWFYGDKELYANYCTRLARRGFAVVNFNYRLAPEYRYPAPLEDICQVMRWMQAHGEEYGLDLGNVFMLGDSAGGQLCHQVLILLTNPEYRKFFAFAPPENFRVNACALNCGCYFLPFSRIFPPKAMGAMFEAYLPEDYVPILPQLKVSRYTTGDFPPAFVMSGVYDYLKFMARPMYRLLRRRGVEAVLKIYGEKGQKEIGHVFHVNCRLPLADQCNDEQCAFFRAHMV